ncbi:C-signal-like isoform X3 [Sylvia atricapilla]|uniref:C-signal-like isoform X3 n=1 Tax=Sylvia atricapilla TaxID=48155 RepID=UPI0033955504
MTKVPWELHLGAAGKEKHVPPCFCQQHCHCAITSVAKSTLEPPATESGKEVANPTSIKAAAAKVGEYLGGSGLNLLINNAGMIKSKMLDAETLEDMTETYTTNAAGPLLMGQAFLPLLKKAAQGSPGSGLSCSKAAIVNISSIAGSIECCFGWELIQNASYRISKAALNMLSKCQSLAYKEHGILCVALHPGWVQTELGGAAGHTPPTTVDDSVQGMLKVLSSLSEKETGAFLDWEGKVVPW